MSLVVNIHHITFSSVHCVKVRLVFLIFFLFVYFWIAFNGSFFFLSNYQTASAGPNGTLTFVVLCISFCYFGEITRQLWWAEVRVTDSTELTQHFTHTGHCLYYNLGRRCVARVLQGRTARSLNKASVGSIHCAGERVGAAHWLATAFSFTVTKHIPPPHDVKGFDVASLPCLPPTDGGQGAAHCQTRLCLAQHGCPHHYKTFTEERFLLTSSLGLYFVLLFKMKEVSGIEHSGRRVDQRRRH